MPKSSALIAGLFSSSHLVRLRAHASKVSHSVRCDALGEAVVPFAVPNISTMRSTIAKTLRDATIAHARSPRQVATRPQRAAGGADAAASATMFLAKHCPSTRTRCAHPSARSAAQQVGACAPPDDDDGAAVTNAAMRCGLVLAAAAAGQPGVASTPAAGGVDGVLVAATAAAV